MTISIYVDVTMATEWPLSLGGFINVHLLYIQVMMYNACIMYVFTCIIYCTCMYNVCVYM